VIIDDKIGEVVGFWKQVPTMPTAPPEIYGIGGSWFRLNADGKIEWQRDFFDFGHVQKLYMKLMKEGKLSKGMSEAHRAQPGRREAARLLPAGRGPVPIW
jgi:hypothetical protein